MGVVAADIEVGLAVEVVGKRPENEPYVWIGKDGKFVGTLNVKQMRQLARDIDAALLKR